MKKTALKYLVLPIFCLISSCTTLVKTPEQRISKEVADKSWQIVLSQFVDEDGWVDFEGLKKNPEHLNNYIAFVAETNPNQRSDLFPTPEAKLAHYINSYNALSIYNILDSGIPETHAGLRKIKFFALKEMKIGGEVMSLKTYEDDIIRKQGDPRIHFALNCMAASCPKLPRVPFEAAQLDQQLDAGTRYFFSEKRNLTIDPVQKVALTTEILDFFPQDFLAHAPTLTDYINKYSTQKIPADFELKFFSYDWTVINQSKKPAALQK